jgi:hypothetical protein
MKPCRSSYLGDDSSAAASPNAEETEMEISGPSKRGICQAELSLFCSLARFCSPPRCALHSADPVYALFSSPPNFNFLRSLSITSILEHMHGVVNVCKKITNCTV